MSKRTISEWENHTGTPIGEAEASAFERRVSSGQTGWYSKSTSKKWPLTPYNACSFNEGGDVIATYRCGCCSGKGWTTKPKHWSRETES